MIKINQRDLDWLSGWVEGEGTFYSNGAAVLQIVVTSIDKDTIERACNLFDLKPKFLDRSMKPRTQDNWRFVLHGPRAKELMELLFPLMGKRRQAQIQRALDKYDARPQCRSFTEDELLYVRTSSWSVKQLAAKFSVSNSVIYNIRKYKGKYKKAEQ